MVIKTYVLPKITKTLLQVLKKVFVPQYQDEENIPRLNYQKHSLLLKFIFLFISDQP